jgi:hypothetical protein
VYENEEPLLSVAGPDRHVFVGGMRHFGKQKEKRIRDGK